MWSYTYYAVLYVFAYLDFRRSAAARYTLVRHVSLVQRLSWHRPCARRSRTCACVERDVFSSGLCVRGVLFTATPFSTPDSGARQHAGELPAAAGAGREGMLLRSTLDINPEPKRSESMCEREAEMETEILVGLAGSIGGMLQSWRYPRLRRRQGQGQGRQGQGRQEGRWHWRLERRMAVPVVGEPILAGSKRQPASPHIIVLVD